MVAASNSLSSRHPFNLPPAGSAASVSGQAPDSAPVRTEAETEVAPYEVGTTDSAASAGESVGGSPSSRDDAFLVAPESIRGSAVAMRAFTNTAPVDAEIRGITNDLANATRDANRLHKQQEAINQVLAAIHTRFAASKDTDKHDLRSLVVTGSGVPGETAFQLLERVGLGERAGLSATQTIATEESLGNVAEQLHQAQTSISGNNQQKMIALQDLSHQRSLLLELETNALSARSQLENRIAENIR